VLLLSVVLLLVWCYH